MARGCMEADSVYNMRVGASAVIVRDNRVLVVGFDDDSGLHFNLPGGGIEPNESIVDGLRREVKEETCANVRVGHLLLVTEYYPEAHDFRYGTTRKLMLFFRCFLMEGSEPRQPDVPDAHQIAVRWIPIADLADVPLLPNVGGRLADLLRQDVPNLFTDRA